MSTICKLDPRIRERRSERAVAARVTTRLAEIALSQGRFAEGIRGLRVAGQLERLRRNPRLTGRQKHARFNRLIKETSNG